MAGSTFTPFKADRSPRRRALLPSATASSATAATAGSRTPPPRPAWPRCPGGYGHGVAVGDYDNDGRPDLFVTRWRSYALYHNLGEGRFEDVTAQRRARRRSRLADLGGLGRPRQRRRPRPLCLPLPEMGRGQPHSLRYPATAAGTTTTATRAAFPRCRTMSFATTAAGSST